MIGTRARRRAGRRRAGVRVALASVLAMGLASVAVAHPLAPSLLALVEGEPGIFEVSWKISRLRPAGQDVRPVLPAHCQRLEASTYEEGPADRTERWRVDCGERGLVGSRLAVRGLDATRTDALLRVQLADGRSVRALVDGDGKGFEVPERESAWDVFRSYVGLGVEHLLFGFDHVLFVIGLVMLVHGWRKLVGTITAFTVGHSVTLSLATLGWIQLPSSLFEIAIAGSIWVLGAELVRPQAPGAETSALRRRPWGMSFGFGLLHGLGFAGALGEIGLPQHEIPLALFAFNVGVEIGQLMVVAPALVVFAWWRRRELPVPGWLAAVPAYGIGSLAAYWMIERTLGALGLA